MQNSETWTRIQKLIWGCISKQKPPITADEMNFLLKNLFNFFAETAIPGTEARGSGGPEMCLGYS